MSSRKLPNYLRTYRKRACLSQDEVAYVLGCKSGAKISRYENNSRLPTPETIFAYEILFAAVARTLFAGRYAATEQKTLRRVSRLEHKLSKTKANPITERKVELLRAALSAHRNKISKHS
jgi:transcriptional regulator with XRE-family HTH domain